MRRLPSFGYDELLRHPPLADPPPRKRYLAITGPVVWMPLGLSCFVVIGLFYLRNHPREFPRLLNLLSTILLWINGVDTESFFVVPVSRLWAVILIMVTMQGLVTLLTLPAIELTSWLRPNFLECHLGTALGRMKKRFESEWKGEDGMHGSASRRRSSKARLAEIYRRFDPGKLTLLERKRFWRSALRAWIFLPLIIAWLAYELPFYTLDEGGIREHRHWEDKFTPWSEVVSLDLLPRNQRSSSSVDEDSHGSELQFEAILRTNEKALDLNEMGALSADPLLTKRLVEFSRRQNVNVGCEMEPVEEEQLKNYLTTPKNSPYGDLEKEMAAFILELCQSSKNSKRQI